jgi:hypothetical protein
MNAPKFTFSEQDNTLGVGALAKGISGFMGKFLKGPFAKPDEVIYNWQQFEAIYGGFSSISTDPLLVYRALDSGANLRICRVGHYDDLTDPESLAAEKAVPTRSVIVLLDRDTSTGSIMNATLNGQSIAALSTGSHEEFMEQIVEVLSISGQTKAFAFKTNNNTNLRGLLVCSLVSSDITLTITFSNTVNGPSVRANAQVQPTGTVVQGKEYILQNATTGESISSYQAIAGDTLAIVASNLRSNVIAPYQSTGSGTNVGVEAPLTPYATAYNGNVLKLTQLVQAIPETRAFVNYKIAVGGAIGETISIENASFGGVLGTYTIQSGMPTATGIAAAINSGGSGCLALGVGPDIFIRPPAGLGDLANGEVISFVTSGVFEVSNPTDAMQGGITAVPGSEEEVTDIFENGANGGTGNPSLSIEDFEGASNAENAVMFIPRPKYEGQGGNNLRLRIENASNGQPDYFNLRLEDVTIPGSSELYQNLKVEGQTLEEQVFLNAINENSNLMSFDYVSLTGTYNEPKRPLNCDYRFKDGTDGDSPEIGDYIGSQVAGIGFHAFNPYNDMMQFCTGEASTIELHEAGAEYADTFKNMVYIGHIDSSLTYTQMVALMESSSIDTSWAAFYTGSLKVRHPITGSPIQISEIGDILGAFAKSDTEFGEWAAVFNTKRGLIKNTQGVVKNFGGESNYEILNLLANNRINCVITENGKTMIWGNTTAQKTTSVLQFLNIRRLGLYIKKSLSPVMKEYLSEPNVPSTWFEIYVRVKPFLDGLVQKEALYTYTWKGDQFANQNLSNLVVNNAADVQAGKYKAILSASAVPGMNEFDLILTYDFTSGTVDIQAA